MLADTMSVLSVCHPLMPSKKTYHGKKGHSTSSGEAMGTQSCTLGPTLGKKDIFYPLHLSSSANVCWR